ncbi:kinase-like domain-containing protein [Dactylonectria estremocensis]|uniref:non-specific serine/threonine protein kinase n=1 Tax=Dactylonectria estremocensis TaxID=1079267 RepID=A0A9P9JLS0_9HYPO|nr:kinase-like domain-containing protein [Dactylonectria estremocensis]
MTARPARVSDLVRDSQLRTVVSLGLTHHTYYASSPDPQLRRTRIKEAWRRGRELGNGTFGRVWLETCEAGPKLSQLRAVKEIPKDRTLSSSIDYGRELEAMAKFSHDRYVHCFVRSYGWYESRDTVFIAMEYVQHGDLQKYLVSIFPEAEVKQIASQLAEGLFFMHDNGFAHRDLKPANILVSHPRPDWWVKISDFGISKRAEAGSFLRTFVGTPGYLAPELIGVFPLSEPRPSSNSRSQSAYTTAVDMWALGEIAVRLLTRRSTFPESPDLFDYVVRETPFPRQVFEGQEFSSECFAFLEKAMAPSPSQRLSASEALAHSWLRTSRPSSPASSRESSR